MQTEERQRIPLADYCRMTGMNYSTAATKIARDQKNGTQHMPPSVKDENGKVFLLLLDEQLSELRMSNAPIAHEKLTRNDELLISYLENLEDERENSGKLSEQLEQLKLKNEQLRDSLEHERIKLAKLEGGLEKVEQLFEAKEQTIQSLERTVQSREGQLASLNNERLILTQQLQAYRAKDELTIYQGPIKKSGLLRKIASFLMS